MRRFVAVYSVFFLVFFVLGGSNEYRVRQAQRSRSILLRTAAQRFNSGSGSYHCGKHALFEFDLRTQSLTKVTALDAEISDKEEGLSGETIAFIATGVSMGKASEFLSEEAGLTAKDKFVALAGAFSGYYAGRYLFRKTPPACDGPETVDLLEHINGGELFRAMTLENLSRYVLVTESGSVPMMSKAQQIRDTYYAWKSQDDGIKSQEVSVSHKYCEDKFSPEMWEYASLDAHTDCFDVVTAKLSLSSSLPSTADYLVSSAAPLDVAYLIQKNSPFFQSHLGLGKIYYVDKKANIIAAENAALTHRRRSCAIHGGIRGIGWLVLYSDARFS